VTDGDRSPTSGGVQLSHQNNHTSKTRLSYSFNFLTAKSSRLLCNGYWITFRLSHNHRTIIRHLFFLGQLKLELLTFNRFFNADDVSYLSVFPCDCPRDISKSCRWILMEFLEVRDRVTSTSWSDFGDKLDHDADTECFNEIFIIAR